MPPKKKTLEEEYQKLTQYEHILKRPDTYVGSDKETVAKMWVMEEGKEHFTEKEITYVPGLYKIFDEILVNAADNVQRDSNTTKIKIVLDQEKGMISVMNNGKGIPVEIHKKEKIYIPEMIFGFLLTGSNFDDNKKKVTGGRNGFGAKLANIFSNKFIIETVDGDRDKYFRMVWKNNMSNKSEPVISSANDKEDFTRVTFYPDVSKFNLTELTDDIMSLFRKRVYDLAGVLGKKVRVYLNNELIKTNTFMKYADLYMYKKKENSFKIHHSIPRWEIVVTLADGQFQQTSFVNSICTTRGGKHVNHIVDQLVNKLVEEIQKKNKKLDIKPFMIKNNIWVFVNCLIENPAFDSQTKETLNTNVSSFGSKCELPQKFLKELLKTDLLNHIILTAEAKQNALMKRNLKGKKKNRVLGITKLEDANKAGSKDSQNCFLIVTEGDSAKSLAMAGLEVVGRDYYGVFPLKGKLVNVREVNPSKIMANEEIKNIIEIIGLQHGVKYESTKDLRYGGIMIMADQDVDGSHIKGLFMNFISYYWPGLIKTNSFLVQFVTPIIKASRRGGEIISFYTLMDFKNWAEQNDLKKWKIKYYKGLGTSTDKEAREYFREIDKHRIEFLFEDDTDLESIDKAFNKKKTDQRKQWLSHFNENEIVDHNIKSLRYKDFINKELIHFSIYDNMRSIPSAVDGLKPGQRKILFSCFKKKLTKEIKVAQLTGYVAENSAYHHGEASLQGTIVGLAQNYVGSNNINLLLPIGQFGTRARGGKDAASARYINTSLNPITRTIFIADDDYLLCPLDCDKGCLLTILCLFLLF